MIVDWSKQWVVIVGFAVVAEATGGGVVPPPDISGDGGRHLGPGVVGIVGIGSAFGSMSGAGPLGIVESVQTSGLVVAGLVAGTTEA